MTMTVTFGELMDTANRTNDNKMKEFLRRSFLVYCKQKNLIPTSAEAIIQWRKELFKTDTEKLK